MPALPRRLCLFPGCCKVVGSGYCKEHKAKYERSADSAAWHGLYNAEWRRYRLTYLAEHPLCVACPLYRLTPATVVDHIQPHRGNRSLFWDAGNHQALCKQCHDRKTAKETAGFGS
jgi:5-methylcytosine-specific restriction protein A